MKKNFEFVDLSRIGDYWEKYEGDFKDNKMHGFGKITFSNDEVYDG